MRASQCTVGAGARLEFSRRSLQRPQDHQIARAAINPKPTINAVAIPIASRTESSVSLSGSPVGTASPLSSNAVLRPPLAAWPSAPSVVELLGYFLGTHATIQCCGQVAHPHFRGPLAATFATSVRPHN
jgi:hypothetical protein